MMWMSAASLVSEAVGTRKVGAAVLVEQVRCIAPGT